MHLGCTGTSRLQRYLARRLNRQPVETGFVFDTLIVVFILVVAGFVFGLKGTLGVEVHKFVVKHSFSMEFVVTALDRPGDRSSAQNRVKI